ncbi:MAG: glycosyltransferase [Erysipelotrichaceae bacterium]|nr:glycosyltransferase [Erysipelotrichaceae bacterium]
MKKIVVVDTAASYGGAMTVLKDFHEAVKKSDKSVEWHFLLSGPYLEETENIKIHIIPDVKSYPQRIYFDLHRGKKIIEKINPDLVFCMQNTLVRGLKVPQVLYVQQSIPFQETYNFSLLKKPELKIAVIQNFLGAIIKNSVKHADKVIVQTKWMNKAVIDQCHISPDLISQVYPTTKEIANRTDYVTTNRFFYPTSIEVYKNIPLIERACQRLDEEGVDYSCQITVNSTGKAKGIYYSGHISLDEVYKSYEGACLVFPSFVEALGYPLLEARSVGSIILASDCNFSHELLDGYENVYFFDPFNADSLYQLMKKVALGEIKRKEITSVSPVGKDTWNEVIRILKENLN